MSNLPSPQPKFWKEVNKELYKFIYDGKQDKIKRSHLIAPYEEGGYRMIDMETQNIAAKISWIQRLQDTEGTWKSYMTNKLPVDARYMARCNVKFKDLPFQLPNKSIWREIWAYWCIHNYDNQPTKPEQIINQNLWFNSHIKINKKTVHYKKWERQGIRWVNDLLSENDDLTLRFLSYEELCEYYDFTPNQLTYQGLIHAFPKSWKRIISNYDGQEIESEEDYKLADRLSDSKQPTKMMYQSILKGKHTSPSATIEKWAQELNLELNEEEILRLQFNQRKCTRNNCLRSFNFKFFHRAIPYESRLHKMGIKANPLCPHCQVKETITHLYWICPQSQRLWERLKVLIETQLKVIFYNTAENCLLGTETKTCKRQRDPVHLLCILTKYYIHVNKCKETEKSVRGLEAYIKSKLKLEKTLAMNNTIHNLFVEKWVDMIHWIDK